MTSPAIERLVGHLGKLPGLGPRSARRAALHLLERRESHLEPLLTALRTAAESVRPCGVCGNLDARDPCAICADPERDRSAICVVEQVADLWALERTLMFRGRYHVLGGLCPRSTGSGRRISPSPAWSRAPARPRSARSSSPPASRWTGRPRRTI